MSALLAEPSARFRSLGVLMDRSGDPCLVSSELADLLAASEHLLSTAQLLESSTNLLDQLGKAWLLRAVRRLQEQADVWLRGGRALPSSEQAALSLIHEMAGELRQAGQALDVAAQHLVGHRASQAKQAGTRALRAAEGLVRA